MATTDLDPGRRHHDGLPAGSTRSPVEQIAAYFRDPVDFLTRNRDLYGPVFTVRFPALPPIVYISDPEWIDRIFGADRGDYAGGKGNRAAYVHRVLGDESVLVQDGHRHAALRASAYAGLNLGDSLITAARHMDEALRRARRQQRFSMLRLAEEVALQTIVGAIFGRELAREHELVECVLSLVDAGNESARWIIEVDALRRRVDAILTTLISRNRTRAAPPGTLLGKLCNAVDEKDRLLTSRSVRDQVMTLLIAGHDSSATTFCWAYYHVLKDPALAERLLFAELQPYLPELTGPDRYERLGSTDFLGRLGNLKRWVEETLRLHAIVPGVHRMTERSVAFKQWRLPKGVIASPAMWLAHRDWGTRPGVFDPERARPPASHYFPFGGASHGCPGSTFGRNEVMVMLLVAIGLHAGGFRLENNYRARTVRRGVTLAPSDGLPVVVR